MAWFRIDGQLAKMANAVADILSGPSSAYDRANHTGTQNASTISDFNSTVGTIISGLSGVNSGLAPLDASGKVPSAYLPSYVDDVLEYSTTGNFPGTGETGKIYVATGTGRIYRWSGSVYVEISASPGSTDAVVEGSTNLYFTQARVRSTPLTGLSLASTADVSDTDTLLQAIGKLQAKVAILETWKTATGIKRSESFSATTDGNGDIVLTFGAAVASTGKVRFIVTSVYSGTDYPLLYGIRSLSTTSATIRTYRNLTLALLGATAAPVPSQAVNITMIELA